MARVPLFRALTDASPDPYSIPLYEPTTEHERGMTAVLTKALELGRPVEVDYRDSAFFGHTGSRPASAWPEPGLVAAASPAGAGGARTDGHVGLSVAGTAELGRRRWRVGGLPSAGC